MILLDTHVLIWFSEGNPRVGAKARTVVQRELPENQVLVSAISFWEIAMLTAKARIEIDMSPEALRRQLLEQGMQEVPVTGDVGIVAAGLSALHGDPADRIIAATALTVGAELMTADERLLRWRGAAKLIDARR